MSGCSEELTDVASQEMSNVVCKLSSVDAINHSFAFLVSTLRSGIAIELSNTEKTVDRL